MADELTGLLGGVMNPDDLKRIMAMFQPTEDDRNAALKQALMTSGLRMLAARKGFEGVAAADAGLMGLQAYQQGMSGVQDAKLKQYKIGSEFQKMAGDQKYSAGLAQQFNGNPALQAMGPGGPTPANAAAVEAVNPQVAKYRAAAQYAAQNGRVKEAETYSNIADKLEEEFSTTPQPVRGADGAVQLAQFGKRGGVKVAQGLTPAEKLQFVNTGGLAGVGIEPYSGKQVSAGLPVTMDPAQKDASARGWAQYQLSKNADARAAKESSAGGKPVWDAGSGQFVFAPTAENPGGASVVPAGYKADTKAQAQKAERAGTVLEIIRQAESIIPKATGSYAGTAADKAAQVFGYSPDGADAIAQLQALEGALMLNQPRMEGPQSDRDTQLYKQMAANIGDPTVPQGKKMAALKAIKALYGKYPNSGTIRFDAQGEPVK